MNQPCDHCGATPVTEQVGPESHRLYFVVCKSDPCAVRKDTGARTFGRPLSNGKPTPAEAEADWASTAAKRSHL
jgi:hypothetical protein